MVVSNDSRKHLNINPKKSMEYYRNLVPSLKEQGVPANMLNKKSPMVRYRVDVMKRQRVNYRHREWIERNRLRRIKKMNKWLANRPQKIKFIWPEEIIEEVRKKASNERKTAKIAAIPEKLWRVNEKLLNKTIFVLRIKDTEGVTPLIKETLSKLRLAKKNIGVFLKYDRRKAHMLKIVENFVTYGVLSDKNVRDLITKRGQALSFNENTNKYDTMAITDNIIIDKQLGQYNIICLEDLVHEVITCGRHFGRVTKFLLPFLLKGMRYSRSKRPFKKGGDCGWRGKKINFLIEELI